MSENGRTGGGKSLGTRVRDWFNGGDPDGRAKLRAWATGDDGRWRGYTHSMGKYVTWLMVIACILYPFTRGSARFWPCSRPSSSWGDES